MSHLVITCKYLELVHNVNNVLGIPELSGIMSKVSDCLSEPFALEQLFGTVLEWSAKFRTQTEVMQIPKVEYERK